MIIAVILGLIVILVGLRLWEARETRVAADANDAGVQALRDGRIDDADHLFRRAARLTSPWRHTAQFNLAAVAVRRGQFDHALATYDRLASRPSPVALHLVNQSLLEKARCLALLGRLDPCDDLLRLAAANAGDRWLARSTLPRAFVRCRQRRFAEAIDLLDEGWAETAGAVASDQIGWLSILKAFAYSSLHPEDRAATTRILLQVPPPSGSELAAVCRDWLELAEFLSSVEESAPAAQS